tara:strand:- start:5191 stop:7527 length:2337 start_codon:yes stop_codon:yes gene_type:complete
MSTITKAIADYSIAVGYGSSTRGKYGISLGTQSEELADGSIAIGHNANAGLTLGNATWTEQTSDTTSTWHGVTYDTPDVGIYAGIPIFVAVSRSGSYSVMTSPDGTNWTVHNTAGDNMDWRGLTSAVPSVGDLSNNTLFVAVAVTGSGQRVMTSQDGINWTLQITNNNNWHSVTHGIPSVGDLSGNTTFVAVSITGTNDRVMTSQDGINWTSQDTTNYNHNWRAVVSGVPSTGVHTGKTLFVAVSDDSYVMRSEDAINWTSQSNPTGGSQTNYGICVGTPNTGTYANQTLFVATGQANSSGVIMISNDGYTWSRITTPGDNYDFVLVTSGIINGITVFVTTSHTVSTNPIMSSYDGENWYLETTPNNRFRGIVAGIPSTGTYADETIFVSVTDTATRPNRVIVSNFSAKNSIAIGTNATTGSENCIAIGNGANAPKANTIILGDGTQNVGIGTTSPDHELTLAGVLQFNSVNSGFSQKYAMYSYDNVFFLNPRDSSGGYDLKPGLTMNSDAYVGIGTNGPSYILDVNGNMRIQNNNNPTLTIQGQANNPTYILFSPGPSFSVNNQIQNHHYEWVNNANNNNMRFYVHNGTTGHYEVLRLSGGPQLYFNGSVKFSSDDRLKKNEAYIENAIASLKKLRPQIYNKYECFTPNTSNNDISNNELYLSDTYTTESGLIAQEVYYDAPELRHLVTIPNDAYVEDTNILSSEDPQIDPDYSNWGSTPSYISYTQLIPYLIKGIQEQQEIIEAEKTKTATLETEVATLKSQMTDLLSRVSALENP